MISIFKDESSIHFTLIVQIVKNSMKHDSNNKQAKFSSRKQYHEQIIIRDENKNKSPHKKRLQGKILYFIKQGCSIALTDVARCQTKWGRRMVGIEEISEPITLPNSRQVFP